MCGVCFCLAHCDISLHASARAKLEEMPLAMEVGEVNMDTILALEEDEMDNEMVGLTGLLSLFLMMFQEFSVWMAKTISNAACLLRVAECKDY